MDVDVEIGLRGGRLSVSGEVEQLRAGSLQLLVVLRQRLPQLLSEGNCSRHGHLVHLAALLQHLGELLHGFREVRESLLRRKELVVHLIGREEGGVVALGKNTGLSRAVHRAIVF